jgi:hypothetical protein
MLIGKGLAALQSSQASSRYTIYCTAVEPGLCKSAHNENKCKIQGTNFAYGKSAARGAGACIPGSFADCALRPRESITEMLG